MSIPAAPDILDRLQHLRSGSKFTEERFYPGAPTEEVRVACEQRVNDFLSDLVASLVSGIEREDAFARAKALSETFAEEDTEEREKVWDYIGEAMRIIGLDDWAEHI